MLTCVAAAMALWLGTATTAKADVEYEWYRYVDTIWVENGWVSSNNNGTKLEIYVDVGYCDYGMGGYIDFDYYSNDGGWMENFKVYPSNGYEGWLSVWSSSTMSEYGTYYITDETYCY